MAVAWACRRRQVGQWSTSTRTLRAPVPDPCTVPWSPELVTRLTGGCAWSKQRKKGGRNCVEMKTFTQAVEDSGWFWLSWRGLSSPLLHSKHRNRFHIGTVAPEAEYGRDATSLTKCDEAEITNTRCIYRLLSKIQRQVCTLEQATTECFYG